MIAEPPKRGYKFWQLLLITLFTSGTVTALINQYFENFREGRIGEIDYATLLVVVGEASRIANELRVDTGAVRVSILHSTHPPSLDTARVSIPFESTSEKVAAREWERRRVDPPYVDLLKDLRSNQWMYIETEGLAENSALAIRYSQDGIESSVLILIQSNDTYTWYLSLAFSERLANPSVIYHYASDDADHLSESLEAFPNH